MYEHLLGYSNRHAESNRMDSPEPTVDSELCDKSCTNRTHLTPKHDDDDDYDDDDDDDGGGGGGDGGGGGGVDDDDDDDDDDEDDDDDDDDDDDEYDNFYGVTMSTCSYKGAFTKTTTHVRDTPSRNKISPPKIKSD